MKYEVIEGAGEWIVRRGGVELARYEGQDAALAEVSRRLEEAAGQDDRPSFGLRFQARTA
jgi:hypothetical protein